MPRGKSVTRRMNIIIASFSSNAFDDHEPLDADHEIRYMQPLLTWTHQLRCYHTNGDAITPMETP
jgi:hypothetical protein